MAGESNRSKKLCVEPVRRRRKLTVAVTTCEEEWGFRADNEITEKREGRLKWEEGGNYNIKIFSF